jgi:hypothetical protein
MRAGPDTQETPVFHEALGEGTGDAHVFLWTSYDRDAHFVRFYRADGSLKGRIARLVEFPELEQDES